MKQYAKCRDYEDGDSFPFVRLDGTEGMHPCNEALYENWIPEAIENDEFNMLILLDGEMVKVRSIHFDFVCDTIEIVWGTDDVLQQRESLTHDQCIEVLKFLDHHHDCNFGITWEHVDIAINELFGEEEFDDEEEEENA